MNRFPGFSYFRKASINILWPAGESSAGNGESADYGMTSRLSTNTLRTLSSQSGVNQLAIDRILGSVNVPFGKTSEGSIEPEIKSYNLGLRIEPMIGAAPDSGMVTELSALLKEYLNTCPAIVNWIGDGGFNPKKLPPAIKFSHVLHASRTAGRLRAKFMKKHPSKTVQ